MSSLTSFPPQPPQGWAETVRESSHPAATKGIPPAGSLWPQNQMEKLGVVAAGCGFPKMASRASPGSKERLRGASGHIHHQKLLLEKENCRKQY